MEKPNYRLGKIGTILEGSILASTKIRSSKKSIEERTFTFLSTCKDYKPSCTEHSCADYEFGCGCLCEPHSECADDPEKEHCKCETVCNYDS